MRQLDLGLRAKKFLDNLPPKQFRQVVQKMFSLLEEPEPPDSRQLVGFAWRRADIGEYRIIYRVQGNTLNIALIGKRNDAEVYRDLERLDRRS